VRQIQADYFSPPELTDEINPENAKIFNNAMAASWKAYRALLKAGLKPEIARYVLPNACTTEIICTWNFRELRHIIKIRTNHAVLPEFRVVAEKIKTIMKEQVPGVFEDL
jgi:thymidylate synthase (FAD)